MIAQLNLKKTNIPLLFSVENARRDVIYSTVLVEEEVWTPIFSRRRPSSNFYAHH